MKYPTQRGFSLVELMVALVIGMIILLGAGQLYVTLRQNQQRAEDIGARQDTLLFVSSTLLRDIRTAKAITADANNPSKLMLTIDGSRSEDYCARSGGDDDVELTYVFDRDQEGVSVVALCPGGTVTGTLATDIRDFEVMPMANDTSYRVTLTLNRVGEGKGRTGNVENLVFEATNRNRVLKKRNNHEADS